MDITHARQIPADGFLVDPVLDRKLLQCRLALYIVGNYLIFVPASTAPKLYSTVLAFFLPAGMFVGLGRVWKTAAVPVSGLGRVRASVLLHRKYSLAAAGIYPWRGISKLCRIEGMKDSYVVADFIGQASRCWKIRPYKSNKAALFLFFLRYWSVVYIL